MIISDPGQNTLLLFLSKAKTFCYQLIISDPGQSILLSFLSKAKTFHYHFCPSQYALNKKKLASNLNDMIENHETSSLQVKQVAEQTIFN